MKKNVKKLLNEINARKAKIKNLVENDQLDEAEAEKKLLAEDQRKFNLLYDLDDDGPGDAGADGNGAPGSMKPAGAGDPEGQPAAAPTAKQVGQALVAAIRARLKGKMAPEKAAAILKRDAEIHAEMYEGAPGTDDDTGEDGGLTVPQDISTEIQELRRATADNLENYVNVEPVSTKTGSRVIEVDADSTEWPEIEEGDDFQDAYLSHRTRLQVWTMRYQRGASRFSPV